MNFIIENWYLIFLAVASGAMLLVSIFRGATGGALSAAAAVHLINREKAVVIDVCEPDEFAAGHVGGSKNVPLGDLEKKLTAAVKNKNVPLILVCQTGARSTSAAMIAKKLGYEQAQSLAGGLVAWKAANLPVEKG